MKLCQIVLPSGEIHAAVVEGDVVFDVAGPVARRVDEYIALAAETGRPLKSVVSKAERAAGVYSLAGLIAEADPGRPRLAIPICPPEVWGAGVTYRRSAEFRDEDAQTASKGIYDHVYSAPRPEIFFKGTAARCVGPNEAIGIRSDSTFTAPEPELALVLDRRGEIVGYTIADDVSAWDVERENPLYLPQSKIYRGCCALGPVLVTPDEVGDATSLRLICRVWRGGAVVFVGEVSTSRMNRSFADLVHYLTLDNPIPDGTVLCTGTGVIVPPEHALAEGDVVEIEVEKLGLLRNPVARLTGRAVPGGGHP